MTSTLKTLMADKKPARFQLRDDKSTVVVARVTAVNTNERNGRDYATLCPNENELLVIAVEDIFTIKITIK